MADSSSLLRFEVIENAVNNDFGSSGENTCTSTINFVHFKPSILPRRKSPVSSPHINTTAFHHSTPINAGHQQQTGSQGFVPNLSPILQEQPQFSGEKEEGSKVRRLMGEMSDLMHMLDANQHRLKDVQSQFYKKQMEAFDKAWAQYHAKAEELKQEKNSEMAKIAELRSNLKKEKESVSSKNALAKQKELEAKLVKSHGVERLAQSKLSELRTKTSTLESEVKEKSQAMEKCQSLLKQQTERLMKSEMSNATYRNLIASMKQQIASLEQQQNQNVGSSRHSGGESTSQQRATSSARGPSLLRISSKSPTALQAPRLNTSASDPLIQLGERERQMSTSFRNYNTVPSEIAEAEMKIVKIEKTERGTEYTMSAKNACLTTTLVILPCDCLLYEYSNDDFHWVSRPGPRVQVYYHSTREVYEVTTPNGNTVRFFTMGQLEVDWAGGARTIVLPNTCRTEHFTLPNDDTIYVERFESYINKQSIKGTRYVVRPDETVEEEFPVDMNCMSMIADRYASITRDNVLDIISSDFLLAYVDDEGKRMVKLVILLDACIDIWMCTDNNFMTRHVEQRRPGAEKRFARVCHSYRRDCDHFHSKA